METSAIRGFELKDALAIAPILWAIFALLFDVGYFWGVEINYFNFFSFTEHLVFAAQVAPYALMLLFLTSISFIAGYLLRTRLRTRAKQLADKGEKLRRYLTILFFLTYTAEVGVLLILIHYGYYRWSLIFVAALILAACLYFADSIRTYLILLGFGLVSAFALGAFLFGHYIGASYLNHDKYEYTLSLKDGSQSAVKLFRSGDRGVLVQRKDDHSLIFHSKDNVKWISSRLE